MFKYFSGWSIFSLFNSKVISSYPICEYKFDIGYSFGPYDLSTRLSVIKSVRFPGERVRRLLNRDSRSLQKTTTVSWQAKCQPVDIYGTKAVEQLWCDVTKLIHGSLSRTVRERSRANYPRRCSETLRAGLVTHGLYMGVCMVSFVIPCLPNPTLDCFSR